MATVTHRDLREASVDSEATNEDPELDPSCPVHDAHLILRPDNPAAKLCFNQIAGSIVAEDQGAFESVKLARRHASQYMWIHPDPVIDPVVDDFIFSSLYPGGNSSPSLHTRIWAGYYFIHLDIPPKDPQRGWTVGCLRRQPNENDIVLAEGLDIPTAINKGPHGIEENHATFQVDGEGSSSLSPSSGYIKVHATDSRAEVRVGDELLHLGSSRVFNQNGFHLRFGNCLYFARYTRTAQQNTPSGRARLANYINRTFYNRALEFPGNSNLVKHLELTPTPSRSTNHIIGPYTMTPRGIIGAGASGSVTVATHRNGKVVALKRLTARRARDKYGIQKSRQTLESITRLIDGTGEQRILRLIEVITSETFGSSSMLDTWFVLEPVVPMSLDSVQLRRRFSRDTHGGPHEASLVLLDLIGALAFLHARNWLHGDIKPPNIGWMPCTSSIVLLDLDRAIHVASHSGLDHSTGRIPPAPDGFGTVGWIAPEQEWTQVGRDGNIPPGFDARVDIWAAAVTIVFLLVAQAYNPLQQEDNPWRAEHTGLIEEFHTKYRSVLNVIGGLNFSLADVLKAMLRFDFTVEAGQTAPRPTAQQVLVMLEEAGVARPSNPGRAHKQQLMEETADIRSTKRPRAS